MKTPITWYLYISNSLGLSYTYEKKNVAFTVIGYTYFVLLTSFCLCYTIRLEVWILAVSVRYFQLKTLCTLLYSQLIISCPILFITYFRLRCKRVVRTIDNMMQFLAIVEEFSTSFINKRRRRQRRKYYRTEWAIVALTLTIVIGQSVATSIHVYETSKNSSINRAPLSMLTAVTATAMVKTWSGFPMVLYSFYLLMLNRCVVRLKFWWSTVTTKCDRNVKRIIDLYKRIIDLLEELTVIYGFSICLPMILIAYNVAFFILQTVSQKRSFSYVYMIVQISFRFSPVLLVFYAAEQVSNNVSIRV